MSPFALSCLGALLLLPVAAALAQPPLDLEGLLVAPVTAGTDALLVRHASDARVPRRWLANVRHDDPLVRATAARVLAVTGVGAALGSLRVALAAETDESARVEQALALLLLGDGAHDVYALGKLAAADTASLERGLLIVGALRPKTMVARVADVQGLQPSRKLPLRAAIGRIVAEGEATVRTALVDEVAKRRHLGLLQALLSAAAEHRQALPVDVLSGVARDPSLAYALLELVASHYRAPGKLLPRTSPLPLEPSSFEVGADQTDADVRVLRELTRRWLGHRSSTDLTSTMADLPADAATWSSVLLAPMTQAESRSYRSRFDHRLTQFGARRSSKRREVGSQPQTPVALMTALPPGLLIALVQATGCRAEEDHDRFAEISYRPDGRPRQVTVVEGAGSPKLTTECQAMLETVVALGYEALGSDRVAAHLILVRLDTDAAACQAAVPLAFDAKENESGEEPLPPTKTRDVKPVYPASMQRAQIQGIVIVDVRLSTSGCAAQARVVRHLVPALDLAALRAASRWTYTPTTIHGRLVEVVLTVSVNFVLQ